MIRFELTTCHAFHNLVVALHDGRFLAAGVAIAEDGVARRDDFPFVMSGREDCFKKSQSYKRNPEYLERRRIRQREAMRRTRAARKQAA